MQSATCFLERIAPSLLPIAAVFLSAAVALVAWLQYRVSRNKLRLDLFDRRYKVFEATRKFLQIARFENTQLLLFKLDTADAEFLFESDVVDWLAEIREKAAHLITVRTLLARPKDDDDLAKLAEAQEADLLRLANRTDTLTKVFTPYLGFGKIK